MVKHLLTLTAALVLAASAQARIIEAGEGQTWWGYFNESDFSTRESLIGTGSAMALMAGIYIPANHESLKGATIKAVRVYIKGSVVSNLSDMKIWISSEVPNKVDEADYVQGDLGTITADANDFSLTAPYEIGSEGFYIGYYVNSSTGYFIRCGGTDAPNSFWVGNPASNMGWTDLYGNGFGKLAFQILVEGATFNNYCATAEDFGPSYVVQGEESTVPITLTNLGKQAITSISYTIATEGGDATSEKTLAVGNLAFNSSSVINVPFPADEEARRHKKTFTITKVNGEENTAQDNSAEGEVISLTQRFTLKPVIEEFTGTWCGWCPRGMTGMEKIHEMYGDQVVQIAVHNGNGDPMQISAYNTVVNDYVDGYPSSITNRHWIADPSFSSLKNVLSVVFKETVPASIELSAEWKTAEQKAVIFNTKTKFGYSDENTKFGIAFVLTEDGLTGTTSKWAQTNYYSGMSTSQAGTDMAWWCGQGSSVTGVEYNHVAVAGWSVRTGVTNSVNATIDATEEQEYTYTGTIPSTSLSLIQDKTRLKAIAMLIDRTNGTILSAAQTTIAEDATGIGDVSSKDDMPVARYSLDGRKLLTPEKGINIVRMNDGTVKKILVK
ncbi:MAG: thioredoxin family protein [Bacteroidaceae bacterium]|nr:thioredoxin family protein [Bacteroidaceae bacterium]